MSHEQPILVHPSPLVETLRPEHLQNQIEVASPSPEQIAAANGVFAQQQESQQVANLLGLWSSAMLMHHLVADSLDTREKEAEDRLRKANRAGVAGEMR